MHQSASALSELRLATRQIHESLESLLPVARPDATRTDYDLYAQDMWGWLAAFEAPLWHARWPAEMEAEARAGKLAWLESDLRHLHGGESVLAALPVCPYRPDLASLASRFGVAYVVEGAQLGTQVLGRRLAPQLAPWSPRWLTGYGERNARNWRAFIACAERRLDSAAARSEAAQAAAAAFGALADWFSVRRRQRAAQALQQARPRAGADLIGSPR